MKSGFKLIKLMGLTLLAIGMYSFANVRGNAKKISGIKIEFAENENMFITTDAVNKLLIQNQVGLENQSKEDIDLNTIERAIRAHDMVKSAQVYLTVNGELTSKIVQRQPVGRIEGSTKFYLDDEGKRMPLSRNHSARVPIITGNVTGESLEDVYEILNYINKDDFLRKNVIGIHIEEVGNYQLKFRLESFVVNLGGVEQLEEKFNNFKAFYAKAMLDDSLGKYSMVSLEFDNQVVCTKI
jgi:cell division protein FtsQ